MEAVQVHPVLMDAKCPDCQRNMVVVSNDSKAAEGWQLECIHDDCENHTRYQWPTVALVPVDD